MDDDVYYVLEIKYEKEKIMLAKVPHTVVQKKKLSNGDDA